MTEPVDVGIEGPWSQMVSALNPGSSPASNATLEDELYWLTHLHFL